MVTMVFVVITLEKDLLNLAQIMDTMGIAIIMDIMVILGITMAKDLQKLAQILDIMDLVIWGLYMDMEYALVMAFITVCFME